mmetsp:Transcript_109204/g.307971  ORF Transcript_109204/g.307971 Transcript_109204/m.307971 type:complete len:518 (-) Transcript_109204:76-1629(-)
MAPPLAPVQASRLAPRVARSQQERQPKAAHASGAQTKWPLAALAFVSASSRSRRQWRSGKLPLARMAMDFKSMSLHEGSDDVAFLFHVKDGAACSFACDADQCLNVALAEIRALVLLQHRRRVLGAGFPLEQAWSKDEHVELRPLRARDALRGEGALPGRPHLWTLSSRAGLLASDVAEIARRCVFLRAVYRPLACGDDVEATAVRAEAVVQQWSAEKRAAPWALHHVRGIHRGAAFSRAAAIDAFSGALGQLGPVNLRSPDIKIAVLEEYDSSCKVHLDPDQAPAPRCFWFAELLGEKPDRWMSPYMLQRRRYISQTTTRPEVAFLIANLAHVSRGYAVLDPVCGSGGLLLVAAACGATGLWGVDANLAALDGRRAVRRGNHSGGCADTDADESAVPSIASNFDALGLQRPVLECGDALDPGLRAYSRTYDALLADLPYGWRELPRFHSLRELAVGVLATAARVLKPRGRAVLTWPEPACAGAAALAAAAGLRLVATLPWDIHERLRRSVVVLEKT